MNRDNDIRRKAAKGATLVALAEEYGVSPQRISQITGPLGRRASGQQPCPIDDCGRTSVARGLCAKHVHRWRVHGDPFWTEPSKGHPRGGIYLVRATATRSNGTDRSVYGITLPREVGEAMLGQPFRFSLTKSGALIYRPAPNGSS